jgi:hypothetical protein
MALKLNSLCGCSWLNSRRAVSTYCWFQRSCRVTSTAPTRRPRAVARLRQRTRPTRHPGRRERFDDLHCLRLAGSRTVSAASEASQQARQERPGRNRGRELNDEGRRGCHAGPRVAGRRTLPIHAAALDADVRDQASPGDEWIPEFLPIQERPPLRSGRPPRGWQETPTGSPAGTLYNAVRAGRSSAENLQTHNE